MAEGLRGEAVLEAYDLVSWSTDAGGEIGGGAVGRKPKGNATCEGSAEDANGVMDGAKEVAEDAWVDRLKVLNASLCPDDELRSDAGLPSYVCGEREVASGAGRGLGLHLNGDMTSRDADDAGEAGDAGEPGSGMCATLLAARAARKPCGGGM